MSEQLHTMPAYAQRLFDYFLGKPDDAETRAEYIARGLIPTNNIGQYIVDEPSEELVPGTGVNNPFNYRRKPFGRFIEALKTDHPELWERAKEANAKSRNLRNQYWQTISASKTTDSAEAQALGAQVDIAGWEKAEVCTRVIEILGPQFDAEGIDIIELCG